VTARWAIATPGTLIATHDRLWVLQAQTATITAVDPSTNRVARRVRLPHPTPYGSFDGRSLWIASYADDVIMRLDPRTGRLLDTIRSSSRARIAEPVGAVAVGPDLWVLDHQPAVLAHFDSRTGAPLGSVRLPGHAASGPTLIGGVLWVGLTAEGEVAAFDPRTGHRVGPWIRVPAGLCAATSAVPGGLWFSSVEFGDFRCHNGAGFLDTGTRRVTSLAAEGHPLYSFAEASGSLWASDTGRQLFRVDADAGVLDPALTLGGTKDVTHLLGAFGSLWAARSATGELLRLDAR
jgi:streptogramin lyase